MRRKGRSCFAPKPAGRYFVSFEDKKRKKIKVGRKLQTHSLAVPGTLSLLLKLYFRDFFLCFSLSFRSDLLQSCNALKRGSETLPGPPTISEISFIANKLFRLAQWSSNVGLVLTSP
jgi:hypothetical protein